MLTPLVFELGKSVLPIFASIAGDYIKKAQEYKQQDVRACENYLEAALQAITGLEQEYDQILVQATNCDLGQPDQIQLLRTRIDTYLKVDIIRPKLKDAVIGLTQCRELLRKNAEGFLLWFWPELQERRQEAVTKFDTLLGELESYLNRLDNAGLRNLKAGTGVGAMTLKQINNYLDSRASNNVDPYGLARLVAHFQRDPSKDHLMDHIKHIRETIHALKNAFQ